MQASMLPAVISPLGHSWLAGRLRSPPGLPPSKLEIQTPFANLPKDWGPQIHSQTLPSPTPPEPSTPAGTEGPGPALQHLCPGCGCGSESTGQGLDPMMVEGEFWVEPQAQLLPLSRAPCWPVAAPAVLCRPPSRASCRPPTGNAAKESRPGEEAFIMGVTGAGTPEPARGWGRLRRPRPRESGAGPASARGRPC